MMKILIVDDKEENLYSLDALLNEIKDKEYSFEVIKALGGEEALRVAMVGKDIRLIILDIQMPDIDGFEVAKLLKLSSVTNHIPIVFLTASFKAEEFVRHGFELGAIDYFTKPIEKFQFLNKIHLYLDVTIKNYQLEKANITIQQKTDEIIKQHDILQQQNKLASMGEMIGAIAHQWRQPLNELGLSIQNLKYDYQFGKIDEEFINEFIEYNKKTIMFMSKTIDDFRSFFRLDKEKSDFNVKEITESVISMLSAQLNNNNIIITIEGDEFIYNGFISEYQQVILNIINNAKDTLIDNNIINPNINILLEKNTIIIKDNAGGIPIDIIDRVFEPYFTTKEQGKGTGIGLYMSKMIIEKNMDGSLSVKNDKDGAIFTIDFNN